MSNEFLWNQFCRLGEMIGDGLADEPDGAWIRKEYRQIAIALGVAKPSDFRKTRKNHNKQINDFMTERLKIAACKKMWRKTKADTLRFITGKMRQMQFNICIRENKTNTNEIKRK